MPFFFFLNCYTYRHLFSRFMAADTACRYVSFRNMLLAQPCHLAGDSAGLFFARAYLTPTAALRLVLLFFSPCLRLLLITAI